MIGTELFDFLDKTAGVGAGCFGVAIIHLMIKVNAVRAIHKAARGITL